MSRPTDAEAGIALLNKVGPQVREIPDHELEQYRKQIAKEFQAEFELSLEGE